MRHTPIFGKIDVVGFEALLASEKIWRARANGKKVQIICPCCNIDTANINYRQHCACQGCPLTQLRDDDNNCYYMGYMEWKDDSTAENAFQMHASIRDTISRYWEFLHAACEI